MPTINEMIDFCEDLAAYDCFSNEQFARREMFYAIADELKKKKRPRGEWKYNPDCVNDEMQAEFFCSICNRGAYSRLDNFCPNCGAKMGADND